MARRALRAPRVQVDQRDTDFGQVVLLCTQAQDGGNLTFLQPAVLEDPEAEGTITDVASTIRCNHVNIRTVELGNPDAHPLVAACSRSKSQTALVEVTKQSRNPKPSLDRAFETLPNGPLHSIQHGHFVVELAKVASSVTSANHRDCCVLQS